LGAKVGKKKTFDRTTTGVLWLLVKGLLRLNIFEEIETASFKLTIAN
jgi:hypothetical protein